jgi:hypothetical protein
VEKLLMKVDTLTNLTLRKLEKLVDKEAELDQETVVGNQAGRLCESTT